MSDWSKRKRLEAVISGGAVDRLPVALWRHWPGDDQEADSLAEAHVQWQHAYDWDLIKVSPASSYCLEDWGVQSRWDGHVEGTRTYTRRVVEAPDDWARLKALDPDEGMLRTQIHTLALLYDHFGEEVPLLATIFSPLAQAKNLAGGERMLAHMRSHPELFAEGLRTIAATTMRYVEEAIKAGISGIFYAIQHARYPLLSPAEYSLFAQPYDEEILGSASELWLNMIHLHGVDVFFGAVEDYAAPFLNWHDRDCGISLSEGLSRFSGAASGGVSRDTMHTGTRDDVRAEALEAVQETGGRRLMLGTGCVIMSNTPTSNVRALRAFVEEGMP